MDWDHYRRSSHEVASGDDDVMSILAEVVAHRAAVAADEERVRAVVGECFKKGLMERGFRNCLGVEGDNIINAIATRAAKQLATAAVRLSEGDRSAIQRVRDGLARICLSTPESRAELAALDRLLATGSTP